jgi:hypothetical protein
MVAGSSPQKLLLSTALYSPLQANHASKITQNIQMLLKVQFMKFVWQELQEN